MEIKKHVDYDKNTGKVYGFTNIGNGALDDDQQPQASKVLLVLAVGINGSWRLPVAYYLTDGTNAELQASLLNTVISKLWENGCCVVSVTMDGLAANQKTFQLLGCSLDPDNLVSLFPHPVYKDFSVAAIFDACHMMKLARNALCEYQIFKIPNVGRAKWQHIECLQNMQSSQGLTLANKLTASHIRFKTQKMKVRLAVQVLSSSCARALEYLRTSGYNDFTDSEGTEAFLCKLDLLFDILNSRSVHGKGYKAVLSSVKIQMKIAVLRRLFCYSCRTRLVSGLY